MLLGVYEVFCGGLVNTKYDNLQQFNIFFRKGQPLVVFSGNTNDYNAAILLLIACGRGVGPLREKGGAQQRNAVVSGVLFAGGYFLAIGRRRAACARSDISHPAARCRCMPFSSREKCRWVPIVIPCCFLSVQFISHSHYIIPRPRHMCRVWRTRTSRT